MGFFNNVFRKHFVSHHDKFIEQHGHFCAKFLNHIDKLDFNKCPDGLISKVVDFPSNSPFCFLNEFKINTLEIVKSTAILNVLEHVMTVEGISLDKIREDFAIKISQATNNKYDKREVVLSLVKCSEHYKKVILDNGNFSNINAVYLDSYDVETPEILDGVFTSFYIIQGYFLFLVHFVLESSSFNNSNFKKYDQYRTIAKGYAAFSTSSSFANAESLLTLTGEIYRMEFEVLN